jgi:hypothetical protein
VRSRKRVISLKAAKAEVEHYVVTPRACRTGRRRSI